MYTNVTIVKGGFLLGIQWLVSQHKHVLSLLQCMLLSCYFPCQFKTKVTSTYHLNERTKELHLQHWVHKLSYHLHPTKKQQQKTSSIHLVLLIMRLDSPRSLMVNSIELLFFTPYFYYFSTLNLWPQYFEKPPH